MAADIDSALGPDPRRLAWGSLTKSEVGALGLDIAKARFIAEGFEIHPAGGSTRSTRLVVRRSGGPSYDVRVRTCRLPGGFYAFFTKRSLELNEHRLVVLVLLEDGRPARAYLIPTMAWHTPSSLLIDQEHEGRKSEPEWGMRFSGRSMPLLDDFDFGMRARQLS